MAEFHTFTFEDEEYHIRRPSLKEHEEADALHARTFNAALNNEAPLRSEVEQILRSKGKWTDEMEMQVKTLEREVRDLEYKISCGGVRLDVARKMAIEAIQKDQEASALQAETLALNDITAEGRADNARLNFIFSCVVYNEEGERVYPDLEAWYKDSGSPLAGEVVKQYFKSIMPTLGDTDSVAVRFLKEFDMVDADGNFIDKQGRLVNIDGELVDEDGRLVNEAGQLIDPEGRPIDENGDFIVERQPFIMDDE